MRAGCDAALVAAKVARRRQPEDRDQRSGRTERTSDLRTPACALVKWAGYPSGRTHVAPAVRERDKTRAVVSPRPARSQPSPRRPPILSSARTSPSPPWASTTSCSSPARVRLLLLPSRTGHKELTGAAGPPPLLRTSRQGQARQVVSDAAAQEQEQDRQGRHAARARPADAHVEHPGVQGCVAAGRGGGEMRRELGRHRQGGRRCSARPRSRCRPSCTSGEAGRAGQGRRSGAGTLRDLELTGIAPALALAPNRRQGRLPPLRLALLCRRHRTGRQRARDARDHPPLRRGTRPLLWQRAPPSLGLLVPLAVVARADGRATRSLPRPPLL